MKRMLSAILSLLLVLSLAPPVQAVDGAESPPESEMVAFLIERGFPEDHLATLIPQQIEDLYRLAYDNDTYYLSTVEQPVIQPYVNIPSSQLTLTATYSYTPVTIDGITYMYEIFVYVDYCWNELPFIRKIDAITVNWDSNILVYNGQFSAKDYAYSPAQGKWVTYKTWSRPSRASQGGLGIYTYIDYADQAVGETLSATGLKGSIVFALTPEPRLSMGNAPGSNSTTINCEYVHDKNPLPGSLSFTYQGFSVYVDTGGMQDSASDSARINYTRYE